MRVVRFSPRAVSYMTLYIVELVELTIRGIVDNLSSRAVELQDLLQVFGTFCDNYYSD